MEACIDNPKIEKNLEKDYRLSFKFSQGSAKLQETLFILLGTKYYRRYGRIGALSLSVITDWKSLAMPPKVHQDKGVDQEHIDRESAAESEKFHHYMNHPDLCYLAQDPEAYIHHIAMATEDILRRDLKYVDGHFVYIDIDRTSVNGYLVSDPEHTGRPHRPDATKYSSHFKKYVIDQRPTGSDAFNAIFQDIRTVAQAYPSPFMSRLADAWELHHPERNFYTSDFMPPRMDNELLGQLELV